MLASWNYTDMHIFVFSASNKKIPTNLYRKHAKREAKQGPIQNIPCICKGPKL